MTAKPKPRPPAPLPFSAVEYLALIAAVNLLESYAEDDVATYGADARSAGRALRKVRERLSAGVLRDVERRLAS